MEGFNRSVFIRSIIYGNTAKLLKIKKANGSSHTWTAYVRGYDGVPLDTFVSKVIFKLHESFKPNTVTCTSEPFQITQFGWGEFTLRIEIFFTCKQIRPVEFVHELKLHPDQNLPDAKKVISSYEGGEEFFDEKVVVKEIYDEIIFYEPPNEFRKALCVTNRKIRQGAKHRQLIKQYGPDLSVARAIIENNKIIKITERVRKEIIDKRKFSKGYI